MELSEEEIQERIELAEDLDDVFEYLFVLYLAMLKTGKNVDRDELVQTVLTRYRDVLYDNGLDIDERYPGMYGISQRSSESIVDTTIAYGALNDWYTSEDRAMFLAENEANTIANYEDLMDAIDAGYTTKTWVTMADRKVRETHRDLEGVTISIFEPFDVGGYQMMVPKDDSMGAGPEEIVNCRCSLAWGDRNGDFYRRTENQGVFSVLPERMSKKHIREVANEFGIDISGLTLYIDSKEELLNAWFSGEANPDRIGTVSFFPNAFRSREELVRTIVHEAEHVKQFKEFGSEYVQQHRRMFEDITDKIEDEFVEGAKQKGLL
ncbi:MAG: hypothetical protein IJ680_05780 [Paludibacteraceae bacterium]|nr:hypothetical protein [Paludibacteraceae bacterium]